MKVAAFASASRRHDAAFRLEVVATVRRAAPRPHPRCLPARLGLIVFCCRARARCRTSVVRSGACAGSREGLPGR
jgi:hypothetical protein